MKTGVSPESVSGGGTCARGRRTAPGGPAEPAWPGPGARADRGDPSGARTLSPGLRLPPLAHLLPQRQTRPRGLHSLTFPPVYIYIYIRVRVCMKNLTCFSLERVRGYFPGNHHQAHLGHSLTPPPAAPLSDPQSWRDPSHCTAQQGAGGAPRPSAPRRAPPRARSAPRSAGGPGSALFSSPLPHLLRGHGKRVSRPIWPGTNRRRSALAWGGGRRGCVCALSGRGRLALVLRSCLPR